MKKLLTILVMCFAVFAAKAQVTVILEAHNVWNDGSGYQLLLDADATAYGTIIPTSGGLTSSGAASDATYAEFEYKIPENADGSLTTTNVVVDGAVTITIPAGTYDFCVTNPTPSDRVWIAAGENGRQDDYVFQDGWTYHFTVAMNGSNDNVTIEVIPNEPAVVANPAALDFGQTITTAPATLETVITGYNLTEGISATVTGEHYTISSDGVTFATTASLPSNGGTLYVQFAPATVETFTGAITLTSGDVTTTINLTGEGFECTTIASYPYFTDFSSAAMNLCWTIEDANNDGTTWQYGDNFAYYIYNSNNAGNDWLISPEFTLSGNEIAHFDYSAYSSSYAEKFEVYVIQGATRTLVIPEITVTSTTMTTLYVDLRSYTGDYQVGIHCTSDADRYAFLVTNFGVVEATPSMTVSEESLDFGTVVVGNDADLTVTVNTLNMSNAIEIATAAPFTVSLDGTSFAATATIPASTELATETPVYVRFSPTSDVEFTGNVTFTAGELNATVALTGNGFECTTVTTFPYETDFSDEVKNLCWTIEDANNDNKTFSFVPASSYATYAYNSSSAADDWLISPVMTLTGSEFATFDYWCASATYPEKFEVYIIQGETRTLILNEVTVTNSTAETTTPIVLNAYTGDYQIGIHCTSAADMFRLYISNFIVDDIANLDATLAVNPESIDFGSNIYTEGMTLTQTVTVNAIKVHELTASVEAPFSISLDGTTFAASVELPDEDPIANTTTLYVQYAPTAAGSHTGTLTITNGETTATVALSGSAADCSANIGTLPFTEDFEGGVFPPTCWSLVSNNTVTWESNVNQNDNSTWAYCNYGSTLQDERLITKTIDFTTTETAVTMTFDFEASYNYVHSDDPEEQYNLLIYASTDDGATFSSTPVFDLRNDVEFENWTITTASVDLSSLIGETTVKLMFNYYGTYGAEMWVDNISIFEGTTGIEEETAANAVSIYPNPASTMLNVHAENYSNVQIINFLGQVVYSANITANDFQINVSNLSNGVYFIRLNGETTTTQKFIKK